MGDSDRNKFPTRKSSRHWSSYPKSNRLNRSQQRADRDRDRELEKSQGTDGSQSSAQQPTILLKNKDSKVETVVEKDRSLSPNNKEGEQKASQVNTDSIKPKIASKSYNLIEYESFVMEPIQNILSDGSDGFLVIGVIGKQGVGKSALCNILAQSYLTSDKINRIIRNRNRDNDNEFNHNNVEGDKNDDGVVESDIIFEEENLEHLKTFNYCTKGIDIYATKNNMIILDSQPVFSIAYQEESYYHPLNQNYEANNHEPCNIKPESRHEITDLQYVTFLLSVCHIVIVIQDWFCDTEMIRLLLTADMLKQPIFTGPNEDELFDNLPQLMILHKNQQMEDFSKSTVKLMHEFYQDIFQSTSMYTNSGLSIANTKIMPLLNLDLLEPFNLYLLPEYEHKHTALSAYLNFEESIKHLRNLVLNSPHDSLNPVGQTQKQWLQYASKVWESIQRNSAFSELSEMLP